jgi:hypothetical protein
LVRPQQQLSLACPTLAAKAVRNTLDNAHLITHNKEHKKCLGRSQWEQKIKELKQKQMEKVLVDGYKATRKEGVAITKDFDSVDLEGWDAY